ncbi:hypothetical protein GCM10017687_39460 [Streptomyces echinatus]
MAYNNLTSRTDAQALIPEEVSSEMLGKATEQSAVLQLFRRVPVSAGQVRFPVLSALPMAYWVTGDTGLKQTTEVNWTNKYLNVEEIATIMPVPDNVLADVDANIWDSAMPLLVEAFGRVLGHRRVLRHERARELPDEPAVGGDRGRELGQRGIDCYAGRLLRRHRQGLRRGRAGRLRRHRVRRRDLDEGQAAGRP